MGKVLSVVLVVFSVSVSAIVVRHDVPDKAYLAEPDDFPPLATFYIDGAHGTLVKPDWVVTAAHATFCVNPGSYIALTNGYHRVERVFVHKDYQPGKSHDIALIKLAKPVNDIEPARLYEQSDEQDKHIWFMGIGGTGDGLKGQVVDNFANAGILRKAQNKVEQASGPWLKFKFDSGAAALPLEGVSGGGDSGGPAYQIHQGKPYVLGISSRFESGGLGRYGVVEVYSRVSFFKAWIEKITSGEETVQAQLATPALTSLPGGLTTSMLPDVCADIGLKPSTTWQAAP
ncbi:hypothetical protein GCM10009092_24960 [Bowmanella denitrificans]|uniref:Peptidase S1 domain-containing protein n=1 Tax=Bowmanella denitrificans TaxID=366582 RepID=A0ABP3H3E5_9ALTE